MLTAIKNMYIYRILYIISVLVSCKSYWYLYLVCISYQYMYPNFLDQIILRYKPVDNRNTDFNAVKCVLITRMQFKLSSLSPANFLIFSKKLIGKFFRYKPGTLKFILIVYRNQISIVSSARLPRMKFFQAFLFNLVLSKWGQKLEHLFLLFVLWQTFLGEFVVTCKLF